MTSFRTFLEYSAVGDVFGFDPAPSDDDKNPADYDDDDDPIRPFGIQRLIDRLSGKRLAGRSAKVPFSDRVSWNDVRARITPNGNAAIERKIRNLEGDGVWYCNKVYKLNIEKFAGYEDAVADDLFDKVTKIDSQRMDVPKKDYQGLQALTRRMAAKLRTVAKDGFIFEDVKKVSEYEYIVYFTLAGAGVGKVVRRIKGGPTPQANVNLSFSPKTGMIRVIFTMVSIEGEGSGWEIEVPYFDGFFCPSQDVEEVTDALACVLKYF